jgi:hypothetical protein
LERLLDENCARHKQASEENGRFLIGKRYLGVGLCE